MFIGEKQTQEGDLGWVSGTRATLRNTGIPLNFSPRRGGSNRLPPAGVWDQRIQDEQDVFTELFGSADPSFEMRSWWLAELDSGPKNELREFTVPPDHRLAVGGFGSNHPSGCFFAFGDGSVRFLSAAIDAITFARYANRADRKFISDEQR